MHGLSQNEKGGYEMNIQIKNRFNESVIFEGEFETLKKAVEHATALKANLSEADLCWVDLSGANLSRADLSSADLKGKTHTIHSIRQISPTGSRDAVCIAFATNKGLWFRAGCFWGDIETFKQKVKESHGDNAHGEDYRAFISLCETWAKRFVDVSR
jgi:hypothetical protein